MANQTGKPHRKEVFDILSISWRNGIRRYDTAPIYGNSESLLGEFIHAHGIADEIKIATKIPRFQNREGFKDEIIRSLRNSLNRLKSKISVLFFHHAADSLVLLREWEFFEQLIEQEPIDQLGVSVYEQNEVEKLAEFTDRLACQFPFNVIDRQFNSARLMTGGRYARSLFLQGVLANKDYIQKSAPTKLKQFHKRFHLYLERQEVDPIELAVSFVTQTDCIDYAVIGVDSTTQIEKLLRIKTISSDRIRAILRGIPRLNKNLRDPRNW